MNTGHKYGMVCITALRRMFTATEYKCLRSFLCAEMIYK